MRLLRCAKLSPLYNPKLALSAGDVTEYVAENEGDMQVGTGDENPADPTKASISPPDPPPAHTAPARPTDAAADARVAARTLLSHGRPSAALATLRGVGLLTVPSAESPMAVKISALFPPVRQQHLPRPPLPPADPSLPRTVGGYQVEAFVKSRAGSKAAGPSGLTYGMLSHLHPSAFSLLALVVNDIIRGDVSPEARMVLIRGRGVPLDKGGNRAGEPRPIVITEVLLRMADALLMRDSVRAIRAAVGPLEACLGLPGGSASFVHAARAILEADPENGIIIGDIVNAFGSFDREEALARVAKSVPAIYPLMRFLYDGPPAPVFFPTTSGQPLIIHPVCGCAQGSSSGMVFFALALAPSLARVRLNHPRVSLPSYADDCTVGGRAPDATAAWEDLKATIHDALNLRVNDGKTQVYFPPGMGAERHPALARRLPPRTVSSAAGEVSSPAEEGTAAPASPPIYGVVLCGAPLGDRAHCINYVSTAAASAIASLNDALSLCSPLLSSPVGEVEAPVQGLVYYTRAVFTAAASYIMRCVPPDIAVDALRSMDTAAVDAMLSAMGSQGAQAEQWPPGTAELWPLALAIPEKEGGGGVIPVGRVAPAAYLAGYATSVRYIAEVTRPFAPLSDNAAAKWLHDIHSRLLTDTVMRANLLRTRADALSVDAVLASANRPKLQAWLMEAANTLALKRLIVRAIELEKDPRTAMAAQQCLLCVQGAQGVSDMIFIQPSTASLRIPDQCMRLWLRRRFFIPVISRQYTCPSCKRVGDIYGYHALYCTGTGEPTLRHSSITDILRKLAADAASYRAISVLPKEPCINGMYDPFEGSPYDPTRVPPGGSVKIKYADLLIYVGGEPFLYDVRFVSPMTGESAEETLKRGESEKMAEYSGFSLPSGPPLTPLVFSSAGPVNVEVSFLVNFLLGMYDPPGPANPTAIEHTIVTPAHEQRTEIYRLMHVQTAIHTGLALLKTGARLPAGIRVLGVGDPTSLPPAIDSISTKTAGWRARMDRRGHPPADLAVARMPARRYAGWIDRQYTRLAIKFGDRIMPAFSGGRGPRNPPLPSIFPPLPSQESAAPPPPPLPPSPPPPTGARRAGVKRARAGEVDAAETGGGPPSSFSPPPSQGEPSAQSAERPRPVVADSFAVKGWTKLAWAITGLLETIPTLKLGAAPTPGAVGALLRNRPVGRSLDEYIPMAVESAARIALQPDMVQAARDDIAGRQTMLTALGTVWESICASASQPEALAILAEARGAGGALQRFV